MPELNDKERTAVLESDMRWIKGQMGELRHDVRLLLHSKWKSAGASAVWSTVAGAAGALLTLAYNFFASKHGG